MSQSQKIYHNLSNISPISHSKISPTLSLYLIHSQSLHYLTLSWIYLSQIYTTISSIAHPSKIQIYHILSISWILTFQDFGYTHLVVPRTCLSINFSKHIEQESSLLLSCSIVDWRIIQWLLKIIEFDILFILVIYIIVLSQNSIS